MFGEKENPRVFKLLWDATLHADPVGGSRHAAAIVYKGRVLTVGTNKEKSHPLCREYQENKSRIYLHAEMDAVIRCMNLHGSEILNGSSLFVLRRTKGNRVGFSKPCPACSKLLEVVGIREIYYS